MLVRYVNSVTYKLGVCIQALVIIKRLSLSFQILSNKNQQ